MQQLEVPDHLFPALSRMVEVLGKKGHDYSNSDDQWGSNFVTTGDHFDMKPWEAADFNELQKLSRLRSLRRRGKPPENESVEDSYLDKANFALLAYALLLHHNAIAHPGSFDLVSATPSYNAITYRSCCHTVEGSDHFAGCETRRAIEVAAGRIPGTTLVPPRTP